MSIALAILTNLASLLGFALAIAWAFRQREARNTEREATDRILKKIQEQSYHAGFNEGYAIGLFDHHRHQTSRN